MRVATPLTRLIHLECSTMEEHLRVMIVDDHSDVLQALATQLSTSPSIEVVGQASEPEEALEAAARLHPDVLLIEPKRQDGRGLELIHLLTNQHSVGALIVLTSYASEWEAWVTRKAGAAAYLLKDINTSDLVQRMLDATIHRAC